jgi:hypothetical protein
VPRPGRALPVRPHLALEPLSRVTLPFHYYRTTFALTENPIAEGGVWSNGKTEGVAWQNMRTTTNKAFGTQSGNSGVYDDSVAVLKGTFGADQEARATVFSTVTAAAYYAEVELLLRGTVSTAGTVQTYEVVFSVNPSAQTQGSYCEIVKWFGPSTGGPGVQFLSLTGQQTITAPTTGAVVRARIVGNTITAYINSTQVAQITDSVGLSGTAPYTTGNPGIGHWLNNNGATGDPTTYGFSDFTAQTLDIRAWRTLVVSQAVNRVANY